MKTLLALLLMVSTLWAQVAEGPAKTAPQQGPPPRNLTVRPDGHISANQDPANPDEFEKYLVRSGDTLSRIAGDALKNPRLWPQLWEQNEHLINPHWIYPNDIILMQPVTPIAEAKPPEPEPEPDLASTEPEAEAQQRPVQLPPRAAPQPAQVAEATAPAVFIVDEQKPVSEIKFEDLYCSGSVRTTPVSKDLKVIAKHDTAGDVLAAEAEYVYISQGALDGIAAGNTYQVMRPTKKMTNPNARRSTDRNLGMHYLDIAQLRVVLVQPDFSLARVIHSCADAVDAGDILVPFQPIVFPQPARPRPLGAMLTTCPTAPCSSPGTGITGMIVSTKDVLLNFGSSFEVTRKIPGVPGGHLGPVERGIASEGSIVYIDIGQGQAVIPGDVFIVYRDFEIDSRLYKLPKETRKLRNVRTAIGELIVVKVGERAATALVTYASDGLALGDTVERR